MTKILIDEQKKTYGVTVYKNNIYLNVTASKEVIISAGSINSPQLLMLSEIGEEKHLENLGLKLIQDLKVGYNLQAHLGFFGALFTYKQLNPHQKSATAPQILDHLYEYLTKRTALLGSTAGAV